MLDDNHQLFLLQGIDKTPLENPHQLRGFSQTKQSIFGYNDVQIFQWRSSLKNWQLIHTYEDQKIESLHSAQQSPMLSIHDEYICIDHEVCFRKTDDQSALMDYSYQYMNGQWYAYNDDHLMKICDEIGHYYLPDSILSIMPTQAGLAVLSVSGLYEVNDSYLNKINLGQDSSWYPLKHALALDNQLLVSNGTKSYTINHLYQVTKLDYHINDVKKSVYQDQQLFAVNNQTIEIYHAMANPPIWPSIIKHKGSSLKPTKKLALSKGDQSLIVQLSTTDWQNKQQIYTYQLEGIHSNWKSFNINEALVIPLNGTNDIKLHVKRQIGDQQFTQRDILNIDLDINEMPSWIKYMATGLLLALLISLFSYLSLQNYKRKFSLLKEQLRMQQTLQEEQNKVRQLQMNPHFLYNALNSINGLIALNENKKARKYLNEFSQLMRAQLNQKASSSVSIEHEVNLLKKYLSLEQLCHQDKFDFEIDYSTEIAKNTMIPGMLVQPFAENAVKHGMRWKEDKGRINISFKPEGNHLVCTIEDDGVGRKISQSKKDDAHESVAINFIKERLANYFRFKSENEIISFEDKEKNGAPTGTIVRILLPILGSNE